MTSLHSIGFSVTFDEYNNVQTYNKDDFNSFRTFFLTTQNSTDRIAKMKIKACQNPKLSDFYVVKMKEIKVNGPKNPSTIFVISSDSLSQIRKIFSISPTLFPRVNSDKNPYILEKRCWKSLMSGLIQETQFYGHEVNDKKSELKTRVNQIEAYRRADQIFDKVSRSPVNLEDEMKLAGLSDEQIAILKAHAAGIKDYKTFLMNAEKNYQCATILGLNHCHIIAGFTEALQCRDYFEAYMELFGNPKENKAFMPRLTDQNKEIIFLVPRQLMDHPKSGVTKDEMQWLLDHPEKMKHIHFVFGAYEPITKISFTSIPYSEFYAREFKDALTTRLFCRIKEMNSQAVALTNEWDDVDNLVNELEKLTLEIESKIEAQRKNELNCLIEEVD